MLTTTTEQLKRKEGWDSLHQKWAETDLILEPQRFGGSGSEQDKWKHSEKRVGKPMTHEQLANYVHKLNSSIIMETSNADPSCAGFYLLTNQGKKYLVAFHKGALPEWSIIETDRADLPIKERRGWRTVLLRLLKQRALSFQQVSRIIQAHYGYAPNEWNRVWYEHTKDFR